MHCCPLLIYKAVLKAAFFFLSPSTCAWGQSGYCVYNMILKLPFSKPGTSLLCPPPTLFWVFSSGTQTPLTAGSSLLSCVCCGCRGGHGALGEPGCGQFVLWNHMGWQKPTCKLPVTFGSRTFSIFSKNFSFCYQILPTWYLAEFRKGETIISREETLNVRLRAITWWK